MSALPFIRISEPLDLLCNVTFEPCLETEIRSDVDVNHTHNISWVETSDDSICDALLSTLPHRCCASSENQNLSDTSSLFLGDYNEDFTPLASHPIFKFCPASLQVAWLPRHIETLGSEYDYVITDYSEHVASFESEHRPSNILIDSINVAIDKPRNLVTDLFAAFTPIDSIAFTSAQLLSTCDFPVQQNESTMSTRLDHKEHCTMVVGEVMRQRRAEFCLPADRYMLRLNHI